MPDFSLTHLQLLPNFTTHWPQKHERMLEQFHDLWKWSNPRLFYIYKHTNKYLNSTRVAMKSMYIAEVQYSDCILLQPTIKHLIILTIKIYWYQHDKLRSCTKQTNKIAFLKIWYSIKCKYKPFPKPWKLNIPFRIWADENLSRSNQWGFKKSTGIVYLLSNT